MTYLRSTNPVISISGSSPIMVTSGALPVVSIDDSTVDQKGAVQLEDSYTSTSTIKAATAKSVKDVYDYTTSVSGDLQVDLDSKSDIGHLHDGRYYTESEVDTISGSLQTDINNKINNATAIKWAIVFGGM